MGSLANFSLLAVVEPNGFVCLMIVPYVRAGTGAGTTVTCSFAYADVGTTTVERPAWVNREFNATAK